MRILLHDYGAYPFTFELARYWADRGHCVRFAYHSEVPEIRGRLPDQRGLELICVGEMRKRRFCSRPIADRAYGSRIAAMIRPRSWDVVVSANTPLDAQQRIVSAARGAGVAFIYWMQDYISRGVDIAVGKKLTKLAGRAVSAWYRKLELRLLRAASAVILASPQFREIASCAGVDKRSCFVIENWCPLGDIAPCPQDNRWARGHGLAGQPVLLYSGTLGLKHDPRQLVTLAEQVPEAKVVIVAEGPGADWLRARQLPINLIALPFEPYGRLSEVLASASVLIAISDDAAASFCFPSKLWTYLAAGRPVLGIMPATSYAASLITSSDAGIVIPPGDLARSCEPIRTLLADPARLAWMSAAARATAQRRCDIAAIGPAMDRVLESIE
jgi:glycosyltransferase involved in cell wall biosynthesis